MPAFLVDESAGVRLCEALKRRGFDALSVTEVMRGASDEEVLSRAIEEERVLVTNDKDLAWLAALRKPAGIILLRLRDESPENKARITLSITERYQNLIRGKIIASERSLRIRPLR